MHTEKPTNEEQTTQTTQTPAMQQSKPPRQWEHPADYPDSAQLRWGRREAVRSDLFHIVRKHSGDIGHSYCGVAVTVLAGIPSKEYWPAAKLCIRCRKRRL